MTIFTRAQLGTVATILADASRSEIMPRFRNLGSDAVRAKTGPLDLVTDADEAAERQITAALRAAFPGVLVVGEEAASADSRVMDGMMQADLAVVVDPVDGTNNFASGLPLFGCMASVLIRGEVVASIIHDPVGNDTALALRGEGAWIETATGAQRSLRVADPVPVSQMNGSVSWRFLPKEIGAQVVSRLPKLAGNFAYRCAAHEYRMLAGGFSNFVFYTRLYPWDHAAGWLLHREAGGYSAHFDGSPYRADNILGGIICTSDRASWQALRDALMGD